jgi:hypothetical protein
MIDLHRVPDIICSRNSIGSVTVDPLYLLSGHGDCGKLLGIAA